MKNYLNENVSVIKEILMKDMVYDLWDGEDEDDIIDVKESINSIIGFKDDEMNGFSGVNIKGNSVELGFGIVKSKKDVNEDEIVSFKKRDINGKKVYFIYFDF